MKTKHLRLMQRAYVILFFCFMYLPIAYMIVFSFNGSAMSLVLMIIVLLCMSFTSSFDEDEMEGVS